MSVQSDTLIFKQWHDIGASADYTHLYRDNSLRTGSLHNSNGRYPLYAILTLKDSLSHPVPYSHSPPPIHCQEVGQLAFLFAAVSTGMTNTSV